MDDSLFELIAQQQRLSDVLQELPRWDRNQLLETLPSLLVSHEAVGDRLRSLQQKLHRDVQATTERERVAGLRSAPSPNIDDVALAILRGDLRAASDALLTLGKAKGPLERTANSVKRALQELMSGGVSAIRHLEPAIARLQGDNYEASNALRGAFLIRLGRLYRDELRSLHMAECAFNEAADMLRDQPEPLVERAEWWRRRGSLESAHQVFAAATEQWPHRACGWIGLALIAQSRKVRHEAIAAGQRAADILALDNEPAVALEHVQPTYCATVHIALAKTVKEPAVAELILKRASEREPDLRYVAEICQQHARISEAGRAQQLFNAGQCYIAVGELGDGVECLEKSLELDPDHSAAALRLAQALFRSAHDVTDSAKRVSRLHRALAISNRELGENTPESHLVWGLLSRAHIIELLVEHQAHPREALWQALLDCEHALILDPKNLSYTAAVARLHRKLGMLLTAQATIKNGMDVDARHPMLLEALVLVLSTENELDEADAALAKMSESAWRTAVSAFIAQRRRESSESLRAAVEQLDVALRAIAPVNRGWIYNSIGDCFIALDEVARARERYELALEFSHRANDQVKALCWLGRWSDVVSLGEPQLRDLTNDTPLIACHVGIAYLALGQIDLARGSFERLTATVRGKRALGFIDTLTLDVPRVLALDVAASALIEEVVRRLRTAAPERRSARRELELSLENATGLARQALLLARSRIAITEEDLSGAVECVSTMENTPQKADGSPDAAIHFKYDIAGHKVG